MSDTPTLPPRRCSHSAALAHQTKSLFAFRKKLVQLGHVELAKELADLLGITEIEKALATPAPPASPTT